MKYIQLIFSGILCVLALSSGKPESERPGVTVTLEQSQLFADPDTDSCTVKMVYTLNIPADYIPSCGRLVYRSYFIAGEHRYELTPLVVDGKQNFREEQRLEELTGKLSAYPGAMYLKSDGDGMKIRLSEIVPFQVWMARAKLQANVILEACGRPREYSFLTLTEEGIRVP